MRSNAIVFTIILAQFFTSDIHLTSYVHIPSEYFLMPLIFPLLTTLYIYTARRSRAVKCDSIYYYTSAIFSTRTTSCVICSYASRKLSVISCSCPTDCPLYILYQHNFLHYIYLYHQMHISTQKILFYHLHFLLHIYIYLIAIFNTILTSLIIYFSATSYFLDFRG